MWDVHDWLRLQRRPLHPSVNNPKKMRRRSSHKHYFVWNSSTIQFHGRYTPNSDTYAHTHMSKTQFCLGESLWVKQFRKCFVAMWLPLKDSFIQPFKSAPPRQYKTALRNMKTLVCRWVSYWCLAGNFRGWSIITGNNHPSNPHSHSFPTKHQ